MEEEANANEGNRASEKVIIKSQEISLVNSDVAFKRSSNYTGGSLSLKYLHGELIRLAFI